VSRWYRWEGDDLILQLRVQPRARTHGFAEILGDSIKLRLTAPPVDGNANAQLLAFLADACGVPRTAVSIESGATGRSKRVRVRRPTRLPAPISRD
jgi:uncharacterized protein (TIGR00251 family)